MNKLLTILALGLALAALAACGGNGGESGGGALPTNLNFTGVDIAFEPTEATVKTGETITVNFNNTGALEHNWILVAPGVEPADATEADALGGASSGKLAAGESATFTFIAPPAGQYQIVCNIEGHVEAGMVATLNVQN